MILPFSWLKDYVDVDVTPETLQEKLFSCGFEVEELTYLGKDVENSILAALNALELGVKRVICKVISDDHAKILRKIGAEVIFPEIEIGRRTAIKLCERLAEDILPLSDEFSIIQIRTPEALDSRSIKEIKLREKYGISLIAVIQDGKANGSVGPDTILHKEEQMVLSGTNNALRKFQDAMN